MVFKRFKNRRNRLYKRKRGMGAYRWGKTGRSLAMKAYKGVQFLKGLVNVEKKFINVQTGNLSPGTTSSVTALNPIAQGSSDVTRNGDSILAKYIQLSGEVFGSASSSQDIVRIVLLCDKENRGTAPTYTDVYTDASVHSYLNKENMDRFIILRDWHFTFSTGSKNAFAFKKFIRLNTHLKYSGNAGNATDIRQNGLYLMVLGVDNTNKALVNVNSRIAFYDN